jgi:DNA-binding NtrC family response regulator
MIKQMNKTIFIVDDDNFWTTMLTEILTNLGYSSISSFSNGADCINELYLNPGLVFLDYQMEDMDGIKVLKKIKTYNSDIPVIFCTENKELSLAVNAMRNGSFDYLVKSNTTSQELSTIIKNMIEALVYSEKVF